MLTPHDIEVKKFGRAFKGYNPYEVDEFLNALMLDYETLYKENSVLKSKMSVLVEKIEEYKSEEVSLRNALVSAQKMGESMLKEANMRSEYIISEAASKAERAMSVVNEQIIKEKRALDEAKRETQLFKARIIALLNSQIDLLEGIPTYSMEDFSSDKGDKEDGLKDFESEDAGQELSGTGEDRETIQVVERAPWQEDGEDIVSDDSDAVFMGDFDEINEYGYARANEETTDVDFDDLSKITSQEF